MSDLHIVKHPIIQERLSRLRSCDTDVETFRRCLHDVARLMCFEITRDLETNDTSIETPMTQTSGCKLHRPLVLVPILRAGVGMANGFSSILREASVGYIGMIRDEQTLQAHSYYCKLPSHIEGADVILVDPMLATGSSSADAADQLKSEGATRIRFACLIAAPEGIEAFHKRHSDIPIYTAARDEKINEKGYIVPGLGDAGDRYFGTLA